MGSTTKKNANIMKEHGELVLDERINRMTIDVFLREMWSETSKAWNGMMEQLYIYDFKLTNDTEQGKVFTSKLRMFNFEVPMLNLPDSCEQTTRIVYLERTTKSIEIHQWYDIEEDPLGIRFKIHGHLEWVKSVNFLIKPAIKYNVTRNLKVSGDIIVQNLHQ